MLSPHGSITEIDATLSHGDCPGFNRSRLGESKYSEEELMAKVASVAITRRNV